MPESYKFVGEILTPLILFIMARPIKETPILYGEDARRFLARMQEHRHISEEERARMEENYRILRATANF